jgi:imidazolonepropionase-like amidohydrolase
VGTDAVIPSGSIIVRGGKIVSVSAGSTNTQGLKVIDAKGMSAMAGFIDAHKHINTGPNEKELMQSLLEAGCTTVLSGGGPGGGSLALRDHIESGMINGPRVTVFGRRLDQSPWKEAWVEAPSRGRRPRIGNWGWAAALLQL